MKLLVTGATGFIGRNLIRRLIERSGNEVLALVRSGSVAPRGTTPLRMTDDDWMSIHDEVVDACPDVIVHLAAAGVDPGDRNLERMLSVNVAWPALLVRTAAACPGSVVVIAGSSAEYAPATTGSRLTESAPLESQRLYGSSKAAGGLMALATSAALAVPTTVLRCFNVYGPDEGAHRLLPSVVGAAIAARPIALSAGTQIRDFIEVGDVCAAIDAASAALRNGTLSSGHYNVCTGFGTSVSEFARTAVAIVGADPDLLRLGALPMRADDLPWLVGDPSRFAQAAGWRARHSVSSGLAHVLAAPTTVPALRPWESPLDRMSSTRWRPTSDD